MSWSFSQKGQPSAVAAAAKSHFAAIKGNFAEPEQTIVGHVAGVIAAACSGMSDKSVIDVSSYGSQSTHGVDGVTEADACNKVTLSISYQRA